MPLIRLLFIVEDESLLTLPTYKLVFNLHKKDIKESRSLSLDLIIIVVGNPNRNVKQKLLRLKRILEM